jgi:hypothetical protein
MNMRVATALACNILELSCGVLYGAEMQNVLRGFVACRTGSGLKDSLFLGCNSIRCVSEEDIALFCFPPVFTLVFCSVYSLTQKMFLQYVG